MKKVAELEARRIEFGNIGIFDGDKLLGYLGQSTYGVNRPTGEWTYTIPEYQLGKVYNAAGCTEKMIDYVNWHAGRSWREAAIKLAHKLGYKD